MVFLNSRTHFDGNLQTNILNYFEERLQKYNYEFRNFNESKSRRLFTLIAIKGTNWLPKINYYYLDTNQNEYLVNHMLIEEIIEEIDPIIKLELQNYLEHLPDDILCDLTMSYQIKFIISC